MIDQREIIWGLVAPPVLMAVGMVVTAHVPPAKRFLSTGALLALVFGVSQLGFRGWPAPGGDVQNWPAWISFVAGLLTLCSLCGHGPFIWRVATRLAVSGIASWLLLRPQLESAGTVAALALVVGLAVVWTMMVLIWERVHATATNGVSVITLTTLACISSVSMLLFDCITHAQYAGILTAALTAMLVVGWWRPAWSDTGGPVTVTALVLPAVWILSHRYADLPIWAVPLLALAGLAPIVTSRGPVRGWSAWKRVVVTVLAILVVTAPVLIWGVVTSIRATAEPSYGY